MYADDTVLISNGASSAEAMNKSQSLYNELLDWCNMNRLTVNINKTKHMLFDLKKRSSLPTHCINGELENVCVYKYLGVEVDDLLSFEKICW